MRIADGSGLSRLDLVRPRQLAALLAAATKAIHEDHAITRETLIAKLRDGPDGTLLDRLFLESHHARHAFLKPHMPRNEVEEQFAEMLYRWRALPTLTREIAESAEAIADMSEAEFERFAALQQEVASVGLKQDTDDTAMRDARQRFQDTLARLKSAPPAKGRRRER